jgi:hypothetical protein
MKDKIIKSLIKFSFWLISKLQDFIDWLRSL